jgi:hypothetical protein
MTNETDRCHNRGREKRPIPRRDQKAATLVPSAVAPKNESLPLSLFFSAFGDENA